MDEFLCEYVDDTMDRSIRDAFEECVQCDSRLARQVSRLRGTRRLLCEHRFRTPKDLRAQVRNRLSRCLPFAKPVRPPHTSILVGTATAIGLAAALVAGTSRHGPTSFSGSRSSIGSATEIQMEDPWYARKVDSGSLESIPLIQGS